MSGDEPKESNEPQPVIGQPQITSTDKSLLTRYRRGDDDAATELYLRYADRLRALATHQTSALLQQRVDAEDMVQSVFRTFFRRAAIGQYDIPEGDELWKLLLVIGLNKIRYAGAFHRADKRDISKTTSADELKFSLTTQRGGDEVALNVLRLTIDEMLEPLPDIVREIVQQRIAGHEINDISQSTGRSKRSVERILQEFRQKLGGMVHVDT